MDRGLRGPVRRAALSPRPPTPAGAAVPIPRLSLRGPRCPRRSWTKPWVFCMGRCVCFPRGHLFSGFRPIFIVIFPNWGDADARGPPWVHPWPRWAGLGARRAGASAHVPASFLPAGHMRSETRGHPRAPWLGRSSPAEGRQVTSRAQVSPFEVTCGRSFLYRLSPAVFFCNVLRLKKKDSVVCEHRIALSLRPCPAGSQNLSRGPWAPWPWAGLSGRRPDLLPPRRVSPEFCAQMPLEPRASVLGTVRVWPAGSRNP